MYLYAYKFETRLCTCYVLILYSRQPIPDLNRIKAGPGPSAWILCGKSSNKPNGWPIGWWMMDFWGKHRQKKYSAASPQHLEASWIHWCSLIFQQEKPFENLEIASLQIAKCFNTHFEVTSRSDLEDTKIRVYIWGHIYIYIHVYWYI